MDQIWIVERDPGDGDTIPLAAFAREADATARAAAEDLLSRRQALATTGVEAGMAAWIAQRPHPLRGPDGALRRLPPDAPERAAFSAYADALHAERQRLEAVETAAAASVPEADLPPLSYPRHHVHPLPFTP